MAEFRFHRTWSPQTGINSASRMAKIFSRWQKATAPSRQNEHGREGRRPGSVPAARTLGDTPRPKAVVGGSGLPRPGEVGRPTHATS